MCSQSSSIWPMVSAIAACMGIIATGIYAGCQLHLFRKVHAAKLIYDYVSKFESQEIRIKRADFAAKLLDARATIQLHNDCPILDFFEEVAFMTQKKAFDDEMVINSFAWWIIKYYNAIIADPNLLKNARTKGGYDKLYCETEWLYKKMVKARPSLAEGDYKKFLQNERDQLL